MTPKDLIDDVIPTQDGVGANDAHNAARRARLLSWLNRIYAYTWSYRPWEVTFKEADVTITAVNKFFVALPADYLEFSREGFVFEKDQNREYKERPARLVRRIRREFAGGLQKAIFGIDGGRIIVPFDVGSDTVFALYYRFRAETLIDDATQMVLSDRWADVIRAGLVYKAQQSKNDARPDFGAEYQQQLSIMCAIENPMKTSTRRLPLAVRGAW